MAGPAGELRDLGDRFAGTPEGIISQQLLPTIDGRACVLAAEVLNPTSGIRDIIREGKARELSTTLQTGHQYGMYSMDESLADLYKRGLISYGMALSQAIDPGVLKTLPGRGR